MDVQMSSATCVVLSKLFKSSSIIYVIYVCTVQYIQVRNHKDTFMSDSSSYE